MKKKKSKQPSKYISIKVDLFHLWDTLTLNPELLEFFFPGWSEKKKTSTPYAQRLLFHIYFLGRGVRVWII